jgi:hypothetical protein
MQINAVTKPKYTEKRKHKRTTLLQDIDYEYNSMSFHSRLTEISAGGLFLEAVSSLPVSTVVKLRFRLPNSDRLIHVDGEVRYALPMAGMGIKFLGLTAEDEQYIKNLVERRA